MCRHTGPSKRHGDRQQDQGDRLLPQGPSVRVARPCSLELPPPRRIFRSSASDEPTSRCMRRDLTEATVFGSMMSMLAAFLMVSLFFFVRPAIHQQHHRCPAAPNTQTGFRPTVCSTRPSISVPRTYTSTCTYTGQGQLAEGTCQGLNGPPASPPRREPLTQPRLCSRHSCGCGWRRSCTTS